MSPEQFFKDMSLPAIKAGAQLGMPPKVILAQWALESAYGGSSLARESNNYGGIKYTEHADGRNGSYAAYKSVGSFVADYVRVMSQPYYYEVRQASGIHDTVVALGKSPYAGDLRYSQKLLDVLKNRDVSVTPATNILTVIGGVLGSPILWIGVIAYFLFWD